MSARRVSLDWSVEDAEEVMYLLESEGRRLNDQGFLEDADSLRCAIAAAAPPETKP